MEVTLVRGKPEDLNQYKNLRVSMVKNDPLTNPYFSYDKATKMSDEDWQKEYDTFLDEESGILLFAKVGEEFVGLFTVTFSSNPVDRHSAYLSKLYVLSDYRGLGIGKQLFQGIVEEVLKKDFILKMRLYVTETQKTAIEMYKKFGWKETGRLVKEIFFDGKYYDDLIMDQSYFNRKAI